MPVDRLLPTVEGAELVTLVREIAAAELAPRAAADETAGRFPRDVFRTLGGAGVLGLPFPDRVGGSGQPYEVYLQALEEIAAAWMSVGIGVSVHVMSLGPAREIRNAGAAGGLAASADRGRPARCVRPVRAACRLRHRRDDRASQDHRRRVRTGGVEGLDHPRLRRRLLHRVCPDGRRSTWRHQLLHRGGRRTRTQLRRR